LLIRFVNIFEGFVPPQSGTFQCHVVESGASQFGDQADHLADCLPRGIALSWPSVTPGTRKRGRSLSDINVLRKLSVRSLIPVSKRQKFFNPLPHHAHSLLGPYIAELLSE
jgi:hypothetical protein